MKKGERRRGCTVRIGKKGHLGLKKKSRRQKKSKGVRVGVSKSLGKGKHLLTRGDKNAEVGKLNQGMACLLRLQQKGRRKRKKARFRWITKNEVAGATVLISLMGCFRDDKMGHKGESEKRGKRS